MTELPDFCGADESITQALSRPAPPDRDEDRLRFFSLRSAFGVALHMHQPLIPAGGGELKTAAVISNLQHMIEHPEIQDAHNAPVFRHCYKRMGELVPELLSQGMHPRVMLDYSGCLFFGLQQMGAHDVIDTLKSLTADPASRRCVEWLGTAWGHAVAPSTPATDFRLHVRAWQHHFAAIFGIEALSRLRGFSPPEMALPNHPDACHAFITTLRACGYQWVLVQEHSIEGEDGTPVRCPHLPHLLVARNSSGQTASITALIKTQGSDTKLVGQMQPLSEARVLSPVQMNGAAVPPLVVQIGDGENGRVMMNEFPAAYRQAMREASDSPTPPMNGTEYLAHLAAAGAGPDQFHVIHPLFHRRIFSRFEPGAGPEGLDRAISELKSENPEFHVEGGSWTGNISWVRGYQEVLNPMQTVSALFAEKCLRTGMSPADPRYRQALFHLLITQTSCFRYWGHGVWTGFGVEICRRATEFLHQL